jgi:hypothetical protein
MLSPADLLKLAQDRIEAYVHASAAQSVEEVCEVLLLLGQVCGATSVSLIGKDATRALAERPPPFHVTVKAERSH